MLGMQHERRVDGPGRLFIRVPAGQHVEEVGGMAEVARRRHWVLAVADAVPGGNDGGKAGDQSQGDAQAGLSRSDRDVGIVLGEHGHRRLQNVHRQRLGWACLEGGDDLRGNAALGG